MAKVTSPENTTGGTEAAAVIETAIRTDPGRNTKSVLKKFDNEASEYLKLGIRLITVSGNIPVDMEHELSARFPALIIRRDPDVKTTKFHLTNGKVIEI